MPNLFLFKRKFLETVWGSLGGKVRKKLAILPLHVHCINLHMVDETNFFYK